MLFVDVMLLQHAMQHGVPSRERMIGMHDRAVVAAAVPEKTGDHRRFGKGQVLRMFTEVQPRCGLDSIRAVTEVHLIGVELEDLILGEVFLDVHREKNLVDLSRPAFFRREKYLLRKLLGESRRAFDFLPGDEVFQAGAEDRFRIESAMVVEIGVLGGDDRLHERRSHVALGDHDPFLNRVLRERHSVAVVDAGDDRRLIVLE